jgi:hypothetical protein
MVLIRVIPTHVFSGFWIFEALNGVLMEYELPKNFGEATRSKYRRPRD